MNKYFKYILSGTLGMLMLTSCMQDDFDSPDRKGTGHFKMSVNLTTDVATSFTRAGVDMTPGAVINLRNLWVGVYDVNTGKKLNDDDIIDMEYRQTATGSKLYDLIEVEFSQEWTDQVCVVGVANFDGVTSTDGTSVEDQLKAADTWEKFTQLSVDTESAYADLHGTTTPLLMGYLLDEDDSPLAQVNQFATGTAIDLDHPNADEHIFFTPSDLDQKTGSDGKVILVPSGKFLRLRKLVSQVNVNVGQGENITVSNIKFKKMNMPKSVYLAERVTDAENLGNTTEKAKTLSPNSSDVNPTGPEGLYASDTEWTEANVGQYGFTFQQFENKHWSTTAAAYTDRGKKNEDGSFAALGSDYNNPNVYASYFVISMNVVDHSKGTSADVEYIVPEGYCSDEEGKPLYNQATQTVSSNKIFKDFSCFRNTDYTYNILVNGIDNIVVNVTSNNGVHYDDQSGMIWEIKYPDGVSHYDLIPVTGGTYNNFVQFTTDSEGMDADGNEGVCFRLMGLDENNEPIDIFYNVPDEVVTQFTAVWPATAPHNRFFTTDDDINQILEETPTDLLEAFTIGGMNIIDFLQSNPRAGAYTVSVKSNAGKSGMRALYVANKKDFMKGITDGDGCTTRHTLYGAVQTGPYIKIVDQAGNRINSLTVNWNDEDSQLKAQVYPNSSTPITWSTSDKDILNINATTGMIYPSDGNGGVAIITATCGDLSTSIPVTVRKVIISGKKTAYAGEMIQLNAATLPYMIDDHVYTWGSNSANATISSTGLVTTNQSPNVNEQTTKAVVYADWGRTKGTHEITISNLMLRSGYTTTSTLKNSIDITSGTTNTVYAYLFIPPTMPKGTVSVTMPNDYITNYSKGNESNVSANSGTALYQYRYISLGFRAGTATTTDRTITVPITYNGQTINLTINYKKPN